MQGIKQKIKDKSRICWKELMARVNTNSLTDDSGSSFSSDAGKVKIKKSHYWQLGT